MSAALAAAGRPSVAMTAATPERARILLYDACTARSFPPSCVIVQTGMEALHWIGLRVQDAEGAGLGRAAGLIVDRESGDPLWLLVARDHEHHRCVPLAGIVAGGGRITVPWLRRVIERGPLVPGDGGLSPRFERELCDVFGLTPTRGARLSRWERRRSASRAWIDAEGAVHWEPPQRGPAGDERRAGDDRRDRQGPPSPALAERRRLADRRDVSPEHAHLPEALRGRITEPPRH